MSDTILASISKACNVKDITNKFQCQLLELACRQIKIFVELWRRKHDSLTSSQRGALRELHIVMSRCLTLIRSYGEEDILLRVLGSRHNPLEFEQLVEDLWTWCTIIINDGTLDMLIQEAATIFEQDLKVSAEQDRLDLIVKLQDMRANMENMDNVRAQIVDFLLEDMDNGQFKGGLFEIKFEQIHLNGKQLGEGVSGAVVDASWLGRNIAVNATRMETGAMLGLTHPNVVQVFGYSTAHQQDEMNGANETWLALEMMNTDLKKHIERCKSEPGKFPFSRLVSVDIMLQIARGMKYLHSMGVAHRDLKPHNILVNYREDGSLTLKVADFGVSKPEFFSLEQDHTYMRGTPVYMAPEMLQLEEETGFYHRNVDVYSFGITCSEILTGEQPFGRHFRIAELRDMLSNNNRPLLPANCPKGLEQLISRCWDSDPSLRPNFEEICHELWCLKAEAVAGYDHQLSALRSPRTQVSMKNLRITGNPVVGDKLIAEAEFEEADLSCICVWVREHSDGSRLRLEPFQVMKQDIKPEYRVTAEDAHSRIALECLPMTTECIQPWQLITVRTQEINYDSRTRVEVGLNLKKPQAEFRIQLKGQWWSEKRATLILNYDNYQLWWNQGNRRNVREKYTSQVSLIPAKEDPLACTLYSSSGTRRDIRFFDATTRHVAVLTFTKFVSKYMEDLVDTH